MQNLPEQWQKLYNEFPPLVNRKHIAEKTGLIAVGTLANLDSQGKGITGAKLVGKRIFYPKLEVITWLMEYAGEKVEA